MGEIINMSSFTEGLQEGEKAYDAGTDKLDAFFDQIWDGAIQSIEPENRTYKNVLCKAFAELIDVLLTDDYLNMPIDEVNNMSEEESAEMVKEAFLAFEDKTDVDLTDYIPK